MTMRNIWLIAIISIVLGTVSCSDNNDDKTIYTVTFETNGGSPAPKAQSVEAGETVTAPATNFIKAGYVFVFWYLNGSTTAYNFQNPVTSNITLYAKWLEETIAEYWQVTWELNDGTWTTEDNHATQVIKGGTLPEPTTPTKSGYTFGGWYKEPALTNKVSFPYDVSNVSVNFTLYAKWITGDQSGTITLDKTSLSLRTTNRERLTATTSASTISWSSSNSQVAIVNNQGIVTATGAGTAVITASAGSKSASCNVNVSYSVIVGGYNSYADQQCVLWKNGEEIKFASYNAPKGINAVFVYEGDIYLVGTKTETFYGDLFNDAVVLRVQSAIPGEQNSQNVTDQLLERRRRSFGEDIFISNGDVYVAGYEILKNNYNQEYNRAVLWKNGKRQQDLSTSEAGLNAEARSVFVTGNNVYTTGNGGYYVNDGVWKNGQFELLNAPPESVRAKAHAISVSGNDVYVAGEAYYKTNYSWEMTKPVLWKNGVPTVLSERGVLYSVFVSGNDVYAAGNDDTSPVWKNGIPMSFDGNPLIKSVYVYGNDVYATGSEGLWINGVKQSWGKYGNSVFVK